MYALLRGLQGSMPHLPVVAAQAADGTRVSHPGYQE